MSLGEVDHTFEKEQRVYPIVIDFYFEPSEYFQVQWAQKNDCLLFVDKYECFVIEFEGGYQRKRKLPQMEDKVVHHIHEDPENTGFFILCSREYDELIELEHSHRDEL